MLLGDVCKDVMRRRDARAFAGFSRFGASLCLRDIISRGELALSHFARGYRRCHGASDFAAKPP